MAERPVVPATRLPNIIVPNVNAQQPSTRLESRTLNPESRVHLELHRKQSGPKCVGSPLTAAGFTKMNISFISHYRRAQIPATTGPFDAGLATVAGKGIGEALTISALLLPLERLSDIMGRKQVYFVANTIFLIASAQQSSHDLLRWKRPSERLLPGQKQGREQWVR